MGDQRGGHQGADGPADAVGAVQESQGGCAIGKAGAEDVVEGEVEGEAQADEEECHYNDWERGAAA